jgi:hypothetical protein
VSEQDIAAVMAAAMSEEDQRRLLASRTPGAGSALPMEQPAAGPAVGKYGLPGLEIAGEGYAMTAPDAVQHKSYGPPSPQYAPGIIGGLGFTAGKSEPAISVYLGQRSQDGPVFVSPPGRPGLLSRLLARVRGR